MPRPGQQQPPPPPQQQQPHVGGPPYGAAAAYGPTAVTGGAGQPPPAGTGGSSSGGPVRARHPHHSNTAQLRYLLATYNAGMLALETLARRVHDDRPQAKYARNPPYGEDVKWLLRISKKLGTQYLHQFCVCVVNSIVSPFVLHEVAIESAHYLSRNNPALVMHHLRSALTPLMNKCQSIATEPTGTSTLLGSKAPVTTSATVGMPTQSAKQQQLRHTKQHVPPSLASAAATTSRPLSDAFTSSSRKPGATGTAPTSTHRIALPVGHKIDGASTNDTHVGNVMQQQQHSVVSLPTSAAAGAPYQLQQHRQQQQQQQQQQQHGPNPIGLD
uniref:ZSWIM4-8 C-terminal domain-containing protein n=1 Tax=Anopheles coluzzii TaxID=1518534 RepID=A0A8W7PUL1_ANOCL